MAMTPSPLPHDTTRPPSCSWRGLLIDSARTFWTVPVMELIITIMARYRLNVLHWHLTDNAGWRIPIPGYPALTSIGAQIPRAPETGTTTPARQNGQAHGARRPHAHHKASILTQTFVTSSASPLSAISASSPRSRSLPAPVPQSAHIHTWETPPSPMHPYRNATRRYGPSPHLSTSSRQPSTTCATYSPPPLFISAHPKPIGVRGKMTPHSSAQA